METSVLGSSHLALLPPSGVMMLGSAGLLLDAYNLTKTGELPATELLFLIKAYKNEDNRCHNDQRFLLGHAFGGKSSS